MKSFYHPIFRKYIFLYRHIPHNCWQGAAFSAVNSFSNGIIFFLAIYFRHELGLSTSLIGLIVSFYSIGTIIGSILSIRLIDKFSSRSICGLSFLVKTGIFLILAKVGMPYKIIMCVFLLGLTSYTFKIANTHWVTRQCDSEKIEHKSINLLYVASNLGLCVSAMIISFAHISEFIDLFYIFAAITLLAIIALKSRDDSLVEYSYSKSMAVVPNKPVLRVALASVFIIGLMIAQISITYPLYLYHMFPDLGLKSVSIVSVIEAFAIIIFQMPLLALLEKQNKILLLGLGVFLYAQVWH